MASGNPPDPESEIKPLSLSTETDFVVHLSMFSLRGEGKGRATHGNWIVRSVPWVGKCEAI